MCQIEASSAQFKRNPICKMCPMCKKVSAAVKESFPDLGQLNWIKISLLQSYIHQII